MSIPSVIMFDAFYPPPVMGGKEKQAHLLAKTLVERHKIKVKALTRWTNENKTKPNEINGVKICRIKSNNQLRELISFYNILRTSKKQFDIVHVHTPSRIGCLVTLISKILGYSVVFKFPNEDLMTKKRGLSSKLLFNLTLKYSDAFVVLEENTKRELINLGYKKNKIFHLPNGIDLPNDYSNHVGNRRENLSVNFRFIHVARLCQQKRTSDILDAFSQIYSDDMELVIVGDGILKKELEQKAKSLGLDDNVLFVGHTEQVDKWLIESDCFILASEKEGMPNVVLEAMKFSLPVISTSVGEVPEMLGEEGKSWQFKTGDIPMLVKLMKEALDNRGDLNKYGESLNRRLISKYSIGSVADKYVGVYKNITKKAGPKI